MNSETMQLKSSIPESAGKQRAQIGLERNGGVVTVPCLNKEECGRLRDFMDEMTMRFSLFIIALFRHTVENIYLTLVP